MQGDPLIPRKAKQSTEDKHIATFEAWISPTKSAILAGGDGGQVKFELAADETKALLELIAHGQQKILVVSVFER